MATPTVAPLPFLEYAGPIIAAASIRVLELLTESDQLRRQLRDNSRYFRSKMSALGFTLVAGEHPIIPVMLGDACLAQEFAAQMLNEGIYVIGFCYPVVPEGKARIRTQMSAAHSRQDLDAAIAAFERVGKKLNVI